MTWGMYGAFIFTVALLVFTAYFLLGGLPLLVLKHDVPLDSRFVRAFFNVYYKVAFWAAIGATVSYALWGRIAFAAGAAGIGVVVTILRKRFLHAMDEVGARIDGSDAEPIRQFRRMHGAALLINVGLLVVLVWGTIRLSQSFQVPEKGGDSRVTPQQSAGIPALGGRPTDAWTGKWLGPEGTFLEIAEVGEKYRITVRNLDGARTFEGAREGDRITFERDGVRESLHAGSGPDTGMKWLADKTDCLVVKPGEGYCRR